MRLKNPDQIAAVRHLLMTYPELAKNIGSVLLIVAFGLVVTLICYSAKSVNAGEAGTRTLETGSFERIRQGYDGKAFLLVLWSLDCPSCREELKMLGDLRKKYPGLPVVLISPDSSEFRSQLDHVLLSYQLGGIESWIFNEDDEDRLRYEIDPKWYGEILRAYFYNSDRSRTGFSGALKADQIEAWWQKEKG